MNREARRFRHYSNRAMRIFLMALASSLVLGAAASAQENGRIKRKPPTAAEAERIVSEQALNDSLLRKGDIVATDRGFLVFRGMAPDGINDFVPVPNPVRSGSK